MWTEEIIDTNSVGIAEVEAEAGDVKIAVIISAEILETDVNYNEKKILMMEDVSIV